ncbi:MAG: phage tail protein [Arcobacter sp.]|nr:MAG: phage tail protein [Arcobacter sp.]
MSIKRGVVTKVTSDSARVISVTSTLPLALVLTANIQSGIYCFDSQKDALESELISAATTGNIKKYLKLGVDEFPIIVPTIISVVNEGADDAETKSNVINATNALKTAAGTINLASNVGATVSFKPDILAVADYASGDMDICNALITTCDSIKGRTFIDINSELNADAIAQRVNFGSDRVTLAKCPLGKWNTDLNATDDYDSGVILAFLRAYVDGLDEIGYSYSISNRVLPFSSVKYPSEFYAGALDETDPLTEEQIMSFIQYNGIRTWEYATTSIDSIWQDARRVRIFDLAAQAVIDGIFFAIDRDMTALTSAKKSLRAFMDRLVGQEVMVGFNIYLDLERTTATAITAGEFYFQIDAQEMPSPRRIQVTFNRVDSYADRVYKIIEEA